MKKQKALIPKPDKSNLPYLIMDVVLHNTAVVKSINQKQGETPEFRLVPAAPADIVSSIRSLIKQVYDRPCIT